MAIPWTSVTVCANNAVASRNPAVSMPESTSEMPMPTPGSTALAPTAAPLATTVVR